MIHRLYRLINLHEHAFFFMSNIKINPIFRFLISKIEYQTKSDVRLLNIEYKSQSTFYF